MEINILYTTPSNTYFHLYKIYKMKYYINHKTVSHIHHLIIIVGINDKNVLSISSLSICFHLIDYALSHI